MLDLLSGLGQRIDQIANTGRNPVSGAVNPSVVLAILLTADDEEGSRAQQAAAQTITNGLLHSLGIDAGSADGGRMRDRLEPALLTMIIERIGSQLDEKLPGLARCQRVGYGEYVAAAAALGQQPEPAVADGEPAPRYMVCFLGDTDDVVFATVLSPLPGQETTTTESGEAAATTATTSTTTTTTVPEPANALVLGIGLAGSDAGDGAAVTEHVGQVLWNMTAANMNPEVPGLAGVWTSHYRDAAEAAEGQVAIDLDAGTIGGEVVEHWTCASGCGSDQHYSDTDWTAVLDGTLQPDGAGWTVAGSVTISYSGRLARDIEADDCGGTPCFSCTDQVCRWEGTGTGSATLQGRIEGSTATIAFSDGLAADPATMDFEAIRHTEFFMSRLVHTWSLAEPVPAPGS